jgi:hypothetical protein
MAVPGRRPMAVLSRPAMAAPDREPPPRRLPAGPPAAAAGVSARAQVTERAAIGGQLRLPIAWCGTGSRIWRPADPAALGEAGIRARAILAGWRVDALGRLACPGCQRSGPGFRASCPVALRDRDTAIIRAALMAAAVRGDGTAGSLAAGSRRDPGGSGLLPSPASPLNQGRHHKHPGRHDRARQPADPPGESKAHPFHGVVAAMLWRVSRELLANVGSRWRDHQMRRLAS